MSVNSEEYANFLKTYAAISSRMCEIAEFRGVKGTIESIDFFDLFVEATFYDDSDTSWSCEGERSCVSASISLLWDPNWKESLAKIVRNEKECRLRALQKLTQDWGEKSLASSKLKPEIKALKAELGQ
jgi:hypothetical protein